MVESVARKGQKTAMNNDGSPRTPSPLGDGLRHIQVRLADEDVVFLRAILEGYDHLGFIYGVGDGVIYVATTDSQLPALRDFLAPLTEELRVFTISTTCNTEAHQ